MVRLSRHLRAALLGAVCISPVSAEDTKPAEPATLGAVADPSGNDPFYCQERHLGTWFYCTKLKPRPKAETPEASAPARTAAERLDAVTAELRELKAKAILEPTEENIRSYITFQRAQLDRSSMFADMWQRAVWQNPALDYTLQRPVSTLAKRQWTDNRKADRDTVLAHLGERYGIFYFFAQSCAACEVFSPILKSVADSHGIHVMAVSTDGGPSSTFRNYVVDSGQRERMGLRDKVTPAVILFDTRTNRPLPIGYGVMAADELMDRIYQLVATQPGRDY